MSLDEFLKKSLVEINREIVAFFPRRFSKKWLGRVFGLAEFGLDLETLNGSIAVPVWDFLDRGGKRWRPALMLLCAEAVGGLKKNVLPFCVIPELAHAGTLVVDDVEDSTQMRRGKLAMHELFGVDIAINNGTLLYFLPLVLLFSSKKISLKTKVWLYDVYCQEMLKLSFGQGMDIFWHRGLKNSVSENDYLQMCWFKTGTLACMSAKFGAILGGASEKTVGLFGDFASTIGVAFQIHDDVLNLSEELSLGKEFAEDIHEGKRTLLVIHALNNSSKVNSKRLREILSMHPSDMKTKREAISIMRNAGSFEYAKKTANELVLNAWKKLEKNLKPSAAKVLLEEFAGFLVTRKN